MRNSCFLPILLFAFTQLAFPVHASEDAIAEALRRSVREIEPFLVRIDTIGGFDRREGELVNEGATTGFLLDREGFIITSSFNFLHEPSSILVQFHDGTRAVAKIVAKDSNRMLTLLNVDRPPFPSRISGEVGGISKQSEEKSSESAAKPQFSVVEKEKIRIGQWAIAVGRALSNEEPNVSLGIISGKNRIWGKAIQCDAKVSPNNYGGPLLDIQGRVMGILVPLSMMSSGLTAGAEMYDGGVGLAIPMEDVLDVFEKLKQGKDLLGGVLGITFNEIVLYTGPAKIEDVLKRTPAEDCGLKRGDTIIAMNGKKIENAMQASAELHSLNAGDSLKISVQRTSGDSTQRLDFETTLITREEWTRKNRSGKTDGEKGEGPP